jgi:hypothetical protein
VVSFKFDVFAVFRPHYFFSSGISHHILVNVQFYRKGEIYDSTYFIDSALPYCKLPSLIDLPIIPNKAHSEHAEEERQIGRAI